MALHPKAGSLPEEKDLINVEDLIEKFYKEIPNPENPKERIAFGTSGHRGTANNTSFNEAHILAITQAVCDIRKQDNIQGMLFLGMDTHALSAPAFETALEVLIANNVYVAIQKNGGFTPTPAISHAIIRANKGRKANDTARADGIVITPSHNPPTDGGFKYNPPHGGPAGTDETKRIEQRANELLASKNKDVKRVTMKDVRISSYLIQHDFVHEYVNGLESILNMSLIAASGLKIGVDPLGGASMQYWEPIADKYRLNLTLVSNTLDPTFKMVPFDKDGKIRMDCSSPSAMAGLLAYKDKFDIAFSTDPDADRHGIVCKAGLLPSNNYLAVAADYLFQNRPLWKKDAMLGKTVVTSSMLDKVAASHNRKVFEVPVGFKYFVDGLLNGSCGFTCEESAGGSFLCLDGSPWSTDKDGLLLCLLSAEIFASTGKNPAELYKELEEKHGVAHYTRIDSPASDEVRTAFKNFKPEMVKATSLANEPIKSILTNASGNNEAFGGLKVVTDKAWFAARPSGTENICKVYMESFASKEDFELLQKDSVDIVDNLIK